MRLTHREIWLKLYLAVRQAGDDHNQAVYDANHDISFLLDGLEGQSLDSIDMSVAEDDEKC